MYKKTLFQLMKIFFMFSIITYPLLYSYQHQTFPGIPEETSTKWGKSSLANLGYSRVQCTVVPISFNKMSLTCPYGYMTKIVEGGVGINSRKGIHPDGCLIDEDVSLALKGEGNHCLS
jgi:hypothetical protein